MINLFQINNYNIKTNSFTNLLHDKNVAEFEKKIANYVGAKYACSINSATNAIFLLFLQKKIKVKVPTMIPPVVLNGLITSGNEIDFYDDPNWIGHSYILHDFKNYKVIDSAQKICQNQFLNEANPQDVMFFSFYPTKPIGSIDGGMIVSNDYEKISWLKEAVMNGMSFSLNNWERTIKFPGYKMYMNSIQAHIANENFNKLENKKQKLKKLREFYNEKLNLNNTSEHLYRIKVENNNKFIEKMKNNNIICGIHYSCQHLNSVYSKQQNILIESERESKKTVSIPYHEQINLKQAKEIIQKIKMYEKI